MSVMTLLLAGLAYFQIVSGWQQMVFVTVLAALGMVASWWYLPREAIELCFEIVLYPIYRIRGYGPGLVTCPYQGPILIVANHTSWLDPIWLGKVVPRRLIPMMTADFYDLPLMRFLMTHIVHAIRVPSSQFRREAPELLEGIAALDRGECLVLFPEGRLRRSPETSLRQFGQGVWHILRERPNTPVMACWIEGGWGSYFSYANGPPTRNKRFDRWRHIDIAMGEPRIVDPTILEDHRNTRAFLREACGRAREYLGLEAAADIESAESEPAVTSQDDCPVSQE
jgi:1-acyl-sn-glycerol-3-phosphate acyltransferase